MPQTAFCAQSGAMFNLANRRRRAAAAAAGVTAQAGRGRASAVSIKRQEAEQADGPSRGPKGAPQELGCLPDLTAQNNNEKTGQRIHDFEISIDYSSRERGLPRTRSVQWQALRSAREWMSLQMKLQSRGFSPRQPLSERIVDEERRVVVDRRTTSRDVHLKTYSPSATAARPPASSDTTAPCAPRARTTRSRRRASTAPRRHRRSGGPRAHRPCTSRRRTI